MAGSAGERVCDCRFHQRVSNMWHSDVLKCVCLGARAVGLGRPVLYAQSVVDFYCDTLALSHFVFP
jgi:FMN-dependent dehydrogenase